MVPARDTGQVMKDWIWASEDGWKKAKDRLAVLYSEQIEEQLSK